ncbi:hypothetical protein H0H92_000438, partial [Tricholoma furcatifolium]
MQYQAETASGIHTLLEDMATSPGIDLFIPAIDEDGCIGPYTTVETPPDNTVQLARSLLQFLSEEELSEDEDVEISDSELEFGMASPQLTGSEVFSDRQLDILLWLLRVNGIENVPSVSAVKEMNQNLQSTTGVRTVDYKGKLGNRYSCNRLADLVSQEFSNLRVRPHLRFYAEDNGKSVNEYFEAHHWRETARENDSQQIKLTPMAVIRNQHFFLYEPCLLQNGGACIPYEWFKRNGKIHAMCWPALMGETATSGRGWIVDETNHIEVSEDQFSVSFIGWKSSAAVRDLPCPSTILGSQIEGSTVLRPWSRTDPNVGNRWRVKAGGARVYAFPIWLYCDDTSAGLPREHVHQEYNVHFLCTSNIAPPLEMMDGIVSQLEEAWESGIWAYDCVHGEFVLVIPSVVALLGDNPMQSEFSCHVGLMGKLFCRACKVKGYDTNDPDPLQPSAPECDPHTQPDVDLEHPPSPPIVRAGSEGGASD